MNWVGIQVHSNSLTVITDLTCISWVPALFWDNKTNCMYVFTYLLIFTYVYLCFLTFFVKVCDQSERQISRDYESSGAKWWQKCKQKWWDQEWPGKGRTHGWAGAAPDYRSYSCYRLGQVQLECTMILIYGNKILKGSQKAGAVLSWKKIGDKKSKKTGKMDEGSRVPSVLNLNRSLKDYESSVVFTVDPLHV